MTCLVYSKDGKNYSNLMDLSGQMPDSIKYIELPDTLFTTLPLDMSSEEIFSYLDSCYCFDGMHGYKKAVEV